MFRRKCNLLLKVVLVVVLVSALAIQASSAGDTYRIVVRFYDDIQITYTITYPASSAFEEDGEVKTGPQDIPIGGVGTPGSGNLDISSYISTQIYCVDPFTAFHGNVEDLGGHTIGIPGGIADEITGYVSAAPWVMSGAMQYYGDAVRWIAANGYRGIYNHGSADTDPESIASVERLEDLFPTIGLIDREIAVMATKVAIWKVIAPDSIEIKKTTLDGDDARLKTFDALWNGLVVEAKKQLGPGAKPTPVSPEVTVTQFTLEIFEDPLLSDYVEGENDDYNFIGPLTVRAALVDSLGATPLDPGKVFLTPSGLNTGGVRFVSEITPDVNLTGKLLPSGPSDPLYGTARQEQFITGTTGLSGNTWESDEFYVAVPNSRTDPPRSDQVTVNAMAKAPDVKVKGGTPIVFAFELIGVTPKIQDWYAIQAFIGGASEGAIVDLYAEARWNSGNTTIGELYVQKIVEDGDESNDDDTFTFTIYYNTRNEGAPPPVLDRSKKLNLNDFALVGVSGRDEYTFTLKNGGIAIISGLPMVVDINGEGTGGFYEYYYWIEETSKTGYEAPQFVLDIGGSEGVKVDGNMFGPFKLDAEVYDLGFVTVTNKVKPETPETPETPEKPEKPEKPDKPDKPDEPDTPETPGTPDRPDTPDTPDRPDTPDTPDRPDTPESPGTPGTPGTPTTPIDPWGPPFGGRDPSTGDNRDPTSAIAMIMLGINFIMLAEITRRVAKKKSRKTGE